MKIKKYLLLLLLPLLFLTGCSCKENELDKVSADLTNYYMDINIDTENHSLAVSQTIDYRNNYDTNLDTLKFHLYPRSFRRGSNTTVVSKLNYDKCYYNGASFGDITIDSLSINGSTSEIVLTGNDNDILDITLPSTLAPDSSTNISLTYTVSLPNINHRFGYGENTINLGNFYPIACMYENGDFVIDSYHCNGDPFYSDIANYSVSFTAPSNYKVASTGDVISSSNTELNSTYNIEARAVRDFAIVLSDKFNMVSDTINDVTVNYYYYNNQYPNECLQAGVDSIATFSRLFGEYPYKSIDIVEANFVHGGMEYPNLIYISDAVTNQSDFINVIVHEVAHQWWYGIVGNNEYQYGWLDEGLTEYSTLLFYEENPQYSVDVHELIKNTNNSFVTFVDIYEKVFGSSDTSMNRALNQYNNESEYVYVAYVKGMLIFDNIREVIGDEKFFASLQTYFTNNKFKIATPEHLISAFEKASNMPLGEIFSSWIDGKVKIMQIG